ncbi:MAG TPA: PepSY domain-containing protein [Acidobacteriaceae bacterium]
MTKTLTLALATAIIGFAAAPALAASHSSAHTAKVTMSEARQIALRAYPGAQIVNQELEHEHGGSGQRYSFDMRNGKTWREVGVDAMTAKVLENSPQGANPKD